jgi:hypothetical protein
MARSGVTKLVEGLAALREGGPDVCMPSARTPSTLITRPQAMGVIVVEGAIILVIVLTKFRQAVFEALHVHQGRARQVERGPSDDDVDHLGGLRDLLRDLLREGLPHLGRFYGV